MLEQASDDKPKKTQKVLALGEALTTDFNGQPIEVKKIIGGCLLKPLAGFCKGPNYQLEELIEEEQPKDKKKKSKTMTKEQIQMNELRKAQEDLNKVQSQMLGVNHQVETGALANDLEEIGTGVKYVKQDAKGQSQAVKQGHPYSGLKTRQMSRSQFKQKQLQQQTIAHHFQREPRISNATSLATENKENISLNGAKRP